jgi:S1-C subfamily serine protease
MENARQLDVTLYQRLGETVSMELRRNVQRLVLRVPVTERRDQADSLRAMVTPEQNLISRLGVLGLDLTPELARVIPGIREASGVVVAGVAVDVEGSSAPVPGDVIYGVNGAAVRTLADLRSAIAQVAPGAAAVLQIGRQGQLRFLTVTVE